MYCIICFARIFVSFISVYLISVITVTRACGIWNVPRDITSAASTVSTRRPITLRDPTMSPRRTLSRHPDCLGGSTHHSRHRRNAEFHWPLAPNCFQGCCCELCDWYCHGWTSCLCLAWCNRKCYTHQLLLLVVAWLVPIITSHGNFSTSLVWCRMRMMVMVMVMVVVIRLPVLVV